jgi:hypothetical protein
MGAVVRRIVNVPTRRARPRWGSREVWVVRSGGFEEGGGGGDLRPSRDHVAGDLWIQALSSVSSSRPDSQSGRPTRECCGGVERIKVELADA